MVSGVVMFAQMASSALTDVILSDLFLQAAIVDDFSPETPIRVADTSLAGTTRGAWTNQVDRGGRNVDNI